MTDKPFYSKNFDIKSYSTALGSCCSLPIYDSGDGIISGRPGYSRADYDDWRPEEALPKGYKSGLIKCINAYRRVGIIKNMIDLMSDFGCNGITVLHPNKKIEKFYQHWFRRVNGPDRSERFLNCLYKLGNVVIRRQTAKLRKKNENLLYKSIAGNPEVEIEIQNVDRKVIPIKYIFLNPYTVKLLGDEAAVFSDKKRYAIDIPEKFQNFIDSSIDKEHYTILSELPPEILKAIQDGNEYPLDPENTLVFHYKKDDWQEWADPLIFSIIEDVNILRKMKLADLSVLDGAISNTRIYKLGNLEYGLAPTEAGFQRLAELLKVNSVGNTKEIIWGPDIDILDTKTELYKFLGNEKYIPHLAAIYGGLGIPPTLTGTGDSSGTNNSLISLNTLIERLEYGRQKLIEFWEYELEIVRRAMNFSQPAYLEFSISNLGDREAERKLFIELAERDIISDEFVQRKFGAIPEIESARQKLENKERKSNKRPAKASPFHNANFEQDLVKLNISKGDVPDNTTTAPKSGVKVGVEGRPKNSKDTKPRKTRKFVVSKLWIADCYDKLSTELSAAFLKHVGKKNLRSLSSKEFEDLEMLKVGALMNIDLFDESKNVVKIALSKKIDNEKIRFCLDEIAELESELGRHLSVAEKREFYLNCYLDFKMV